MFENLNMILNARSNSYELPGSKVGFIKTVMLCVQEIAVVELDLDLV